MAHGFHGGHLACKTRFFIASRWPRRYAADVFIFEIIFDIIFDFVVVKLFGRLFGRIFPRKELTVGKNAELPTGIAQSISAALAAGRDAGAVLPPGWRSFRTGVSSQAAPEVVARQPIGADLPLTVEPDETHHRYRLRVGDLGYLPTTDGLEDALKRGWVRCWLADRPSTARHGSGAAILFVAVYDPR